MQTTTLFSKGCSLQVVKISCRHIGVGQDAGYIVTSSFGFNFFDDRQKVVDHLFELADSKEREASKPRMLWTRESLLESAETFRDWARKLQAGEEA